MVNFHDPAVIKADYFSLVNFIHCIVGVFIWDFFSTLDFEWDYIVGKRKFRWTLLLYSISRLGALGNGISNLVGFNVAHPINCQQWITFTLIMAYTSFACASGLIALRVIAIWRRNYLVMALTIGMWLTNVGFLLYGIVTVRSTWEGGCVLENTFQSRDNITVTVATDIALLILMLVGLIRSGSRQTNQGIFRHLYVQGLIWLLAATIGELPAAIFINLDLNDPFNLMFQNFAFYTMLICATRMYRALLNYHMDVETFSHGPDTNGDVQFKGREIASGSSAFFSNNRVLSGFADEENWGLSLTDKSTGAIDIEKEATKMPSLTPSA
ncbi:hypothetical protein EI94DRAFT_1799011 [Lactarius quietus]|nr:hypothetical protein EI94DRAFT_1799011 [Lactarius quietus]